MRNWEQLHYTNTFKELVDKFNLNSDSSNFIDKMTGTILCNGVLFNGKETIDGQSILPLQNITLSGIVNSDTILDNFILYFRDENKIIELDQFPIDLLSFNDNKIHFLYIKSDLTYRVSDYMFGRADEILIGRFMITAESKWNHFYLMAQRCGTPMYDAADEFYTVDGMYVKSPGGLELSQTSGSVKRSGIQFIDYNSPDIYEFYNLPSERVPIRYINELNEIDYRQDPVYNVITDKYMIYNMNTKLKIEAETYINDLRDMYYDIENYTTKYADELHTANLSGEDISIKRQIIDNYLISINNIYDVVDNLYDLLGNKVLSDIRRAGLLENKNLIMDFINTNLIDITEINDNQVTYLNQIPYYIKDLNSSICDNPLSLVLDTIEDDLKNITFDVGSIENVPKDKFTLQRILWDIYDKSLIIQYGDTVYDSYDDAVNASELLAYPAPWGKTVYIPLAIMLIKSGITSINGDEDTLIVPRRWIYVDQLQEGFIDYVARAKAQKALDMLDGLEDRLKDYIEQIANSVVNAKFEKAYPIGHILHSENATNPSDYLGFGQWTYEGQGRILVGYNPNDTDFKTVGNTGGSKTVTLKVNNIPPHTHTYTYTSVSFAHDADRTFNSVLVDNFSYSTRNTGSTGGGNPISIMPPYRVVYIWKRIG